MFLKTMDRSRQEWLEHELAMLTLDFMQTYCSDSQEVEEALIEAGRSLYTRHNWLGRGYDQFVIDQAARLLAKARNTDGAWNPEPTIVDEIVGSATEKERASVDEIKNEILAQCKRFEDMGYHETQIARALARVGLTLAPIHFIKRKQGNAESSLQFFELNSRAFLDEALGADRYPGKKKS